MSRPNLFLIQLVFFIPSYFWGGLCVLMLPHTDLRRFGIVGLVYGVAQMVWFHAFWKDATEVIRNGALNEIPWRFTGLSRANDAGRNLASRFPRGMGRVKLHRATPRKGKRRPE